ncbi:MAG: TetR family transcriptional regulator [Alphaproteobacteria bacterium]|nr:TetR family transcriptional regulator [Alphaproteobacteria bacterium]
MKPMTSHPQNDMRDAILRTAIRLFRDVGYYKTTVADIAKVMEMSPANIYRFFSSKKEIHASAARLLMGEVEAAVEEFRLHGEIAVVVGVLVAADVVGARGVDLAILGEPTRGPVLLLSALTILTLSLTPWAAASAVRISLE